MRFALLKSRFACLSCYWTGHGLGRSLQFAAYRTPMCSPAGDSEQQSAIMPFWRQRQFTNLTRLAGGWKFHEFQKETREGKKKQGEKVRNRTTGWGGPASHRWWVLVARATLNRQNNENMALFSELSSNVTFFPHHELFSGICSIETDSSLANITDTRTIYWHLYKLLQQSLLSFPRVWQQTILHSFRPQTH